MMNDIDLSFDVLDWDIDCTVTTTSANYGSKTRCGKIIRKYNYRNENPERYVKRIYHELSAECGRAGKTVRYLNNGELVPTRDGQSFAFEFAVGTFDGDFKTEFTLSVPVTRRK